MVEVEYVVEIYSMFFLIVVIVVLLLVGVVGVSLLSCVVRLVSVGCW